MPDYTEQDLIEMFNERVAIREFDSVTSDRYDAMSEGEMASHRRWAVREGYWDLRKTIGPGIGMPAEVQRMVRAARDA